MKKRTHEEFLKIVKEKYGDEYTVLGKYINCHTPILLKHNKCGNEWDTTQPNDFIKKKKSNKCPLCSHPSRKKNDECFKKEIFNRYGNEYTFLDKYINNMTKLKCRHNKCGYEWKVTPNNFLRKSSHGCPKCYSLNKESKGVKLITKILNDNSINFIKEKSLHDENLNNKNYLKFDFYIENLNLAIEFDGEMHFKPNFGMEALIKQKERDLRKDKYCMKNNINLLRISYFEYSEIKSILKKTFKKFNIDII